VWNVEITGGRSVFEVEKEIGLGRRRRRVIKVVKKKLPSVFTCPVCGEEAIRVKLPIGGGPAVVQCGSCGLKREFEATPSSQIVDIYCMFTDAFYGKKAQPEQAQQPA
jgi:transcription elongation factor Elf1